VVNGRSKIPISKKENTENPKNYRPVTRLPTKYKLITSIISGSVQKCMDNDAKRTVRVCSGSKGRKNQLLISKSILQDCKCREKICIGHGLIIRKLSTGSHTVGYSNL